MQIRWAATDMVPGYLRDCNHLLNMIKCRGEEKENLKGCTLPYFPEDLASLPKPRGCGA